MYRTIAILLTAALLPGAVPAARANNTFGGVNLAGAEFGTAIPGQLGIDYIWPTVEELDHFHARGMNIVRIGFRWERMQPALNGPLDADYLASLDALVAHAATLGIRVILNPHNFADRIARGAPCRVRRFLVAPGHAPSRQPARGVRPHE